MEKIEELQNELKEVDVLEMKLLCEVSDEERLQAMERVKEITAIMKNIRAKQ